MGAAYRAVKVLLDTSLSIWLDNDPPRISQAAQTLLTDPDVDCLLSVISIWEMEIKVALGRLRLSQSVEESVRSLEEKYRIEVISLEREACHVLTKLPSVHGDPFDRMLVCQAISLSVPIVSSDPNIAGYPVKTIW